LHAIREEKERWNANEVGGETFNNGARNGKVKGREKNT
jgi:hypothetical protein